MDQKNSVFVISIIFVFLARSAHGQTTTVAAESSTVSAEVSSSSAEASSSSVSSSVADSFSPSVAESSTVSAEVSSSSAEASSSSVSSLVADSFSSSVAESSTVSAEVSSSSAEASSSSVSSLVADSFSSSVATSSQTSSSIEASSTSTAAVTSSSSASIESPSTSASLTTTSSSAFSTSSASTTPTASLSQTPTTTSSVGSVGSVSSSISPSTTTTTSTSTASSSPKRGANGELQCQVNMNANFTNDMTNKSSAAYRNTCESVLNAIKTAINAKVGSVTMKSCNLTRGSVIANVDSALEDIKFTSDGSDPLVAIQNAVQAITSVGGFSANVSGVEIKFGSDTTVTAFNITKTDFKTDCCKSDFQYTNLTRECYVTKDGQKSPCSNFQTYKTVPCDMKKTHDAYKIGEPVPSDFFDQLCISGSLCVQASMLTLALGFFISKNFY